MRPRLPGTAVLEASLAAASGLLLYLAILALEGLGELLLPRDAPEAARRALFALVEEGAKLCLLFLYRRFYAGAGPRGQAARGLSLGIAAIAVFAAIENLAYFAAFPGWGAAGRLLWSEPVHLVSALALSLGLLAPAAGRGAAAGLRAGAGRSAAPAAPGRAMGDRGSPGGGGRGAARAALALSGGFALAYAWHLAANLAASGLLFPGAAEAPGGAARLLASGTILNAAALWALGRLYLRKAVIGGFLYGKE